MTRRRIIIIVSVSVSVAVVLLTGIGYGGYKMHEQHQEKQRQQLKACQDVIVKDICSKYGGITKIEFYDCHVTPMGGVSYGVHLNEGKFCDMNYLTDIRTVEITSKGYDPKSKPSDGHSNNVSVNYWTGFPER